jgi:hypothetical protein
MLARLVDLTGQRAGAATVNDRSKWVPPPMVAITV